MSPETIVSAVQSMIREYDKTKPKEQQEFNSAWNTALWALLDELGLNDDGCDCHTSDK